MLQAIVVTQGRLAHELLNSAERILGRPLHARSVCLDWDASAEEDRAVLQAALTEYQASDRFLLLTDMPGGTPHRVAAGLVDQTIAVVTGVNLAMVVRLGCVAEDDPRTVQQVADWIVDKGRRAVMAGDCKSSARNGRNA